MSKYKKMKQLIADMRLPEYRYKQLLDAVAASVVSFAQQGLWDYAET